MKITAEDIIDTHCKYKADEHCFTCEKPDCTFPDCQYGGRDSERYKKSVEQMKVRYRKKKAK